MKQRLPLPELQQVASSTLIPTNEQLDAAAAALGIQLPASYREFAKRYGYGLTAGLFIIYVPIEAPRCDSLVDRSRELAEELADSVRDNCIDYKPDGSPEIIRRLIPFGYSESAHILAWDPQLPQNDEYEIYVIGARKFGVRRTASDLREFLLKAVLPGVGGMIGRATFQLDPKFEPWNVPAPDATQED